MKAGTSAAFAAKPFRFIMVVEMQEEAQLAQEVRFDVDM
jgi:hypothetical protein